MSTVLGQTISTIITIRDDLNGPILALTEVDFDTLEAYSVISPLVSADVTLAEVDEGQYSLTFEPTMTGPWALHYVYDDPPVFREETEVFTVETTATITVITSGGAWTYTGDLDDPIQHTRFLIQDVAGDNPLFTDTEVAFALGTFNNNPRRAAASLTERLMARYAAMADTTELDLSVRASQIYDHYKDLYTLLNSSFLDGGSVIPYAGGISNADIMGNQRNTDRRRGTFERNNPWPRYGGIQH